MEIPVWTAGTYAPETPVYKIISGIAYIFIAIATTSVEPTLEGSSDWQLIGKDLSYNSTYSF